MYALPYIPTSEQGCLLEILAEPDDYVAELLNTSLFLQKLIELQAGF